jgi:acetyl-CoA synthetase
MGCARHGADAVAVRYENEAGEQLEKSFREISESAYALAAGLRNLNVVPGDRVGLMLPMSPYAIIAFFGIALAGAVVVPLFTGFGGEALRVRLHDAQVKVLIVAASTRRRGTQDTAQIGSR